MPYHHHIERDGDPEVHELLPMCASTAVCLSVCPNKIDPSSVALLQLSFFPKSFADSVRGYKDRGCHIHTDCFTIDQSFVICQRVGPYKYLLLPTDF